jgi:transcriptional regulator with XRE-family HTH domain
MIISDRLHVLREQKKFSRGTIEKRTGLFCCYISRAENGHTVPAVETLEKFARVLEDPMFDLCLRSYQCGRQPLQSNCSGHCSFCQYSDPASAN